MGGLVRAEVLTGPSIGGWGGMPYRRRDVANGGTARGVTRGRRTTAGLVERQWWRV